MPQITKRLNDKGTGICKFCGSKATLLCDMPKKTIANSIETIYSSTCDNEMCEKCATKFRDFDFCYECMRELRNVWNTKIETT